MTTTKEIPTTIEPTRRSADRVVPVRVKIAATIALVTAAAMASAGLIVYLLESSRIDSGLNQQIDQEIAELRRLQAGTDPDTTRPFASVDRLLDLYIQRNVTDDDEMLVTYVDRAATGSSANQFGDAILSESRYQSVVERLYDSGGTAVIDSPVYEEVWVTVVPITNAGNDSDTGALAIINFADDERSELNRTIQTYAVVTACFLGLITLLAIWRAGQLLSPLTTLRTTAEAIGETDLSMRIPERGNDDITALTRTLNAMLARLEHAFLAQREFLDDAGHELKTPLTVLRGHLELLDPADEQEVEETRELLLDEIDRMSRLVRDLMLLAKSDRPDFVNVAPVDTEALTHTLLSKARGMADRDWQLDSAAPGVVGLDEQRITQAVLQLADNAVKHTTTSDTIAIGSAIVGDRFRLWVRNTGSEIPESDRERIFERFGRSTVHPEDEGFGLGLSIVDAIARAHHGEPALDVDASGVRFLIIVPTRTEKSWRTS